MPNAFILLFALPGFVLCMLAFGAEDVAAGNEVLVELRRLAEQGFADAWLDKMRIIREVGGNIIEFLGQSEHTRV